MNQQIINAHAVRLLQAEMTIDSTKVKGEPGTGFETGADGPFNCGNCNFFDGSSCGQSTMMKRSKRPRVKGHRVKVAADDCCEYVDRKGVN